MALTIFCGWCGEHEFKVAPATVREAGILELQCPQCRKVTSVSARDDGTVCVVPDPLPSAAAATDPADTAEDQMLSLVKDAEQCLARNEADNTIQALSKLTKLMSQRSVKQAPRRTGASDSRH
jgi:phage FluMu protein Com